MICLSFIGVLLALIALFVKLIALKIISLTIIGLGFIVLGWIVQIISLCGKSKTLVRQEAYFYKLVKVQSV